VTAPTVVPFLIARQSRTTAAHLHFNFVEHIWLGLAHVAMLALAMTAQIDFPLEGLLAQPAAERFVPGVLPHVGDEIRALAERFQTDDAFVWLFACKREQKETKDLNERVSNEREIVAAAQRKQHEFQCKVKLNVGIINKKERLIQKYEAATIKYEA
jgi:hypothetical protein